MAVCHGSHIRWLRSHVSFFFCFFLFEVYIVGEVGIEEELDLIGVPHFGGPQVCTIPTAGL